ncbi:hypothetical protein [Nonomuraea aurantiaca]|uniref:hypothetical protein n=1 Tax=Nonomuraea aurantiaca TaxID=2878562 RepID=UPI001CD94F99|nr:hypothetical protein [Nonomuraea aurantiaca]MCA2227505.1 hypothetical protein [Nonomuraea aurantiaca]
MAMPSRVLTEPRELIIEAVAPAEPALKIGWIAAAVDQVADTRAKLRRLAAALAEDADLLTSGRPEVPRLIELLIRELQPHELTRITPPRCVRWDRPGKLARVVDGRRMCQACAASTVGKPRLSCAVCGKTLEVSGRDRDGPPAASSTGPSPKTRSPRWPAS